MVNTEDVVFLGAARCEKGLYGKGGGGLLSISWLCSDNTNRGGCVDQLEPSVPLNTKIPPVPPLPILSSWGGVTYIHGIPHGESHRLLNCYSSVSMSSRPPFPQFDPLVIKGQRAPLDIRV